MSKTLPGYKQAFIDYKHKRKIFDKKIQKCRRSHKRKEVYDLEKSNTSNPTEFWRSISRLGPRKKKNIPLEILLEDGTMVMDHEEVLCKWSHDFN